MLSHFSHVQLCKSMDCSPPGSSVDGILQARILEWIAMPFSRGSSQPRGQTCISYVSCIGRWILFQTNISGRRSQQLGHTALKNISHKYPQMVSIQPSTQNLTYSCSQHPTCLYSWSLKLCWALQWLSFSPLQPALKDWKKRLLIQTHRHQCKATRMENQQNMAIPNEQK